MCARGYRTPHHKSNHNNNRRAATTIAAQTEQHDIVSSFDRFLSLAFTVCSFCIRITKINFSCAVPFGSREWKVECKIQKKRDRERNYALLQFTLKLKQQQMKPFNVRSFNAKGRTFRCVAKRTWFGYVGVLETNANNDTCRMPITWDDWMCDGHKCGCYEWTLLLYSSLA